MYLKNGRIWLVEKHLTPPYTIGIIGELGIRMEGAPSEPSVSNEYVRREGN